MQLAQKTPLSSASSFRGQKVRARSALARQAARPAAVSVKAVVQSPPAAQAPTVKPYGVFNLNYDASKDRTQFGKQWKKPIKIAVSGAAGAIANHLLFTLASGEVFGDDQPISLLMLGSDRSREALEGVAMELEDSLFPLLREVSIGTDPRTLFEGADWALLIGAKPRGPGMERKDLLDINGQIFVDQGRALNDVADPNCKVVVVGNPCNTNAMIAASQAPRLDKRNFHALTRLDENRAKCQLALKSGVHYRSVSNVTIWGNHSTTQVPDFVNARINGQRATSLIDGNWLETQFTATVQTRGGALIKKWGRSSAASTAVSIADHIRSLVVPTPKGDWFSMAVCSDGNPYGVKEGLWYSFPCVSKGDGTYEIVRGLEINPWLREKMLATEKELEAERDCVKHLMGQSGGFCDIKEDTMLPGEN